MADDGEPMTSDDGKATDVTRVFKHVQQACRQAAVEAFEDAQIRGLCAEGAFEAAMQAIDQLKVDHLNLQQIQSDTNKNKDQV